MICVVEGPDGAGKSTLAQRIAVRFDCSVQHEGPPPLKVKILQHYGLSLQRAREEGHNVVFDRLALGERVYGRLLRRYDRLGEEGWLAFQRLITAAGAYQIVCLPPYETCYRVWAARCAERELISDETLFRKTYVAWEDIATHVHQDFIFDHTKDSFDVERLTQRDSLPPHMLGSTTASFLLVGERGGDERSLLDLPFYGATHSALYLNQTLRLAGFHERELAFTNAYHLTSDEQYVINPGSQKVIALGDAASAVCTSQGVLHQTVPHPQFRRRFKHHEMREYARMFEACR